MTQTMRNKCPCCGSFARIRKSHIADSAGLLKQGRLDCMNADCGWRGAFDFTITRTITPSMIDEKEPY